MFAAPQNILVSWYLQGLLMLRIEAWTYLTVIAALRSTYIGI